MIVLVEVKPGVFTGSGFVMDLKTKHKYGIAGGWFMTYLTESPRRELWEIDITEENLTIVLLKWEVTVVEITSRTVLGGVAA